jgi:TetR/AcrR family transcriptional regulator, repressor for uid operon
VSTQERLRPRDERRLATRARLFDAAVAEFKKAGVAAGDIDAIVSEAGVAHGTFFFHFETKEHVLAELGQREEQRIAAQLDTFLRVPRDLAVTLTKVIELTATIERRLGPILFREMLALYFSPARPELQVWPEHPVIALVITAFRRAAEQGRLGDDVDPDSSAMFFFLAHYALVVTQERTRRRAVLLDELVTTVMRAVEPR